MLKIASKWGMCNCSSTVHRVWGSLAFDLLSPLMNLLQLSESWCLQRPQFSQALGHYTSMFDICFHYTSMQVLDSWPSLLSDRSNDRTIDRASSLSLSIIKQANGATHAATRWGGSCVACVCVCVSGPEPTGGRHCWVGIYNICDKFCVNIERAK